MSYFLLGDCFVLCVVLRSQQRESVSPNYPEGPGAEGWRTPHQLQAQGLVDIQTAVLGHTHPHSALWVLRSCVRPRGRFTGDSTEGAVSDRKGSVTTGGRS